MARRRGRVRGQNRGGLSVPTRVVSGRRRPAVAALGGAFAAETGSSAKLARVRLAAVSVDLDELDLYRALYGLAPRGGHEARGVYAVGVARLCAWAARHAIPLTFFCVAGDLARGGRDALLEAIRAGHAVESHSLSHPYFLPGESDAGIAREVGGSFDAIERALGQRPRGFRAPGYQLDERVLDALEREGAAFDASLLPSPPYWLARATALGWLAARGRPSPSRRGPLAHALGPRAPYRPGMAPHTRGERALVELPMTVTRGPRLPIIGTSLALAGPLGAQALVRAAGAPALFSLELHGLDALGPEDAPELAAHEPGLAVSLARKLAALEAAVRELVREGYRFVTLREAAREVATKV